MNNGEISGNSASGGYSTGTNNSGGGVFVNVSYANSSSITFDKTGGTIEGSKDYQLTQNVSVAIWERAACGSQSSIV